MEGLNLVMLAGNLGADPELKSTSAGPLLKMRLATNVTWRDKETKEKKEKTEWHNLTMFGARAEALARFLKKGSPIWVQGHLETSTYEKDGQKHWSTSIILSELKLLDTRGDGRAQETATRPPRPNESNGLTDLPF